MTVAPSVITSTVDLLDDRRLPDLDAIDAQIDQLRYDQGMTLAREYLAQAEILEYEAHFRYRDVPAVTSAKRAEWLEKAATYAQFAAEALTSAATFLPFTAVQVGGSPPAA